MPTELEVTVRGPAGAVDARQALARIAGMLDVLAELEYDRSDKPRQPGQPPPRSRWAFSRLEIGSVRATLAPLEPRPGATFADLERIEARAFTGFSLTEESELLPDGWSVNAARKARQLASGLGTMPDTGMRLALIVDGERRGVVDVTHRTAVNLRRAMQVRRESIGSVTGAIDSMSVHKKPVAGLWSIRGGRRITVDLSTDLVARALEVLGRQVTVRGRIRRNAAGQILGVRASSIEVARDPADAPPLASFVGAIPDLTGGLDPAAYLEAIREA